MTFPHSFNSSTDNFSMHYYAYLFDGCQSSEVDSEHIPVIKYAPSLKTTFHFDEVPAELDKVKSFFTYTICNVGMKSGSFLLVHIWNIFFTASFVSFSSMLLFCLKTSSKIKLYSGNRGLLL